MDNGFPVGSRVRYNNKNDAFSSTNGKTGIVINGIYNSTTNAYVKWDDGSDMTRTPLVGNLELIEQEIPSVVSLQNAWKVGNVVEFTVDAFLRDGELSVGCQAASLSDAQPFLQRLARKGGNSVELTIRGEIKDFSMCSQPGCCDVVGFNDAGVKISYDNAEEFLRDFRIISTPEPVKAPEPEKTVTVTMSQREAEALVALKGKIGGDPDGYRGDACRALRRIGVELGYADSPWGYEQSPAHAELTGDGVSFAPSNPF